jgi:hypothetical protein
MAGFWTVVNARFHRTSWPRHERNPICHGSRVVRGHDRESGVMKREWHSDELMEHWTMLPQEHKLLG